MSKPEFLPTLACVIIDDNPMSRLALQHFIEITDNLTWQVSLPDGVQALNFFRNGGHADVLFLDIEMPHLSGLELLRVLPQPHPQVVLVTSHRDFAEDAFDLQVADYLVKPVAYARFARTVSRLQTNAQLLPADLTTTTDDAHLYVKTNNKLVRLNFDDVYYIEALSAYSILVTEKQKHIVYATLKALAERLPFAHFQRVHRSYVINTHHIHAVEDSMILLGSYEIPLGKAYREDFFSKLRSL
ncbi:LytTR family DNA-binding domain-containing protein [Hymenobacter sp. GOD-10R]|uniref:LytR/AlgR family response regulator transcription factor n=1 Tax=Hymenobacter sp. GOD-10R TaxID=3093922 RepID=UPI002D77DC64|nr:LytTR family DNA-binding domain-containing protein [Hymenobacter sp. GOD-10R]WRQ31586.1 LytTR family DNA-binding domain-containing protein [Hymenobacter sp. GOD-10R]